MEKHNSNQTDATQEAVQREIDRIVDTTGCSYAEARMRVSGVVPKRPLRISPKARTAPGAAEHADEGDYPDLPGDDYIK